MQSDAPKGQQNSAMGRPLPEQARLREKTEVLTSCCAGNLSGRSMIPLFLIMLVLGEKALAAYRWRTGLGLASVSRQAAAGEKTQNHNGLSPSVSLSYVGNQHIDIGPYLSYTAADQKTSILFQSLQLLGTVSSDGILGLRLGTANIAIPQSSGQNQLETARGSGTGFAIFIGSSFKLTKAQKLTVTLEYLTINTSKNLATEGGRKLALDQIALSINYKMTTRSIF